MTPCLGRDAAGLADGSLTPARRERALAHAARCDRCRAVLDAQRAIRARLTAAPAPSVPGDLLPRLAAIGAPLADRPDPVPPPLPALAAVPGTRARSAPARRLVAVGSTASLVTVAGLAVLASAPTAATSVPRAVTPSGWPVTAATARAGVPAAPPSRAVLTGFAPRGTTGTAGTDVAAGAVAVAARVAEPAPPAMGSRPWAVVQRARMPRGGAVPTVWAGARRG